VPPDDSGQAWSTLFTAPATASGGHGAQTEAAFVETLVPEFAASGQTGIGGHATIAVVDLPRSSVAVIGHGSGRQIIAIGPPVTPVPPVAGAPHGSGIQITPPVAPLAPVEACALSRQGIGRQSAGGPTGPLVPVEPIATGQGIGKQGSLAPVAPVAPVGPAPLTTHGGRQR